MWISLGQPHGCCAGGTGMLFDLSNTLVIGMSSTPLFVLSEVGGVFRARFKEDRETAVAEYRAFALKHENDPRDDGTGMPLVGALLSLKK